MKCPLHTVATVLAATLFSTNLPAADIFWNESQLVVRGSSTGSSPQALVSSAGAPTGLALDIPGGKMYWTDQDKGWIHRANINGIRTAEDVLVGLNQPRAIEIDPVGRKLYWTQLGPNTAIRRANLDGSNIEDLVTSGVVTPLGLALDLEHGKVYWSDAFTNKIKRANLDGTIVEDVVLHHGDDFEPMDLAIDPSGKLYWTDFFRGEVRFANLDGSSVETLYDRSDGVGTPDGLALDFENKQVVWIDAGSRRIVAGNLDGSGVRPLYTMLGSIQSGIAIPAPEPVPTGDFNRDGVVDAADYVVWRSKFGHLVSPCSGGDGNCNGFVDNLDYQMWRSNYGAVSSDGMSIPSPEPASWLLACLALCFVRRHR